MKVYYNSVKCTLYFRYCHMKVIEKNGKNENSGI